MRHTLVKNISKALLCGIALTAPLGCKDFLTEKAPSNLTPTNFYTIPDHAVAALAAVYDNMRLLRWWMQVFSLPAGRLLEAPTGTSTTETAQNSDLNNLYSLVYDGNTGHIVNWWNGSYKMIAQANQLLDKVPGITPMDAAQKARIIGEARFLRAWAYFQVVRLWGDAPLITTPQTASTEQFMPVRAPKEDIYKLIVDDLTAAENAGLPWMDVSGHVNLGRYQSHVDPGVPDYGRFPAEQRRVAL